MTRFFKIALTLHRWMGVGLCALFFLWFTSGIVMMYWDFPSVSSRDRLEHSTPLDAARVAILPGEFSQTRLTNFAGRPIYTLQSGPDVERIYADTGEIVTDVTEPMAARIAAEWCGEPIGAARVESIAEPDQWTVQFARRSWQPLWKFAWPDGRQVYVSPAGDVVQYTTPESRFWAWLGAIPHWLYFSGLRKHPGAWSPVVILTSGASTIAALLGLLIAAWTHARSKRIPYRGQKKWHMILGYAFGVGAVTWAFSGMMSMDPFGESAQIASRDIRAALRGRMDSSAFARKTPRQTLAELGDFKVKELELTSFAGEPVYIATMASGDTRIVPVDAAPRAEIGAERVMAAIGPDAATTLIHEYDAFYLDRRNMRPLPVVLARFGDGTRYYIDPKTGRVAGSYSPARWIARWLYHGLHSLDFPWMYRNRPLWDVVMLSFMLGGIALSVTSIILAGGVVKKTVWKERR